MVVNIVLFYFLLFVVVTFSLNYIIYQALILNQKKIKIKKIQYSVEHELFRVSAQSDEKIL